MLELSTTNTKKKTIFLIPPQREDEEDVELDEIAKKKREKEELNNSLIFSDNIDKKLTLNQNKGSNFKNEQKIIPKIFTKRYCNTCNIYRPSKASHCRVCDNCVKNFDQ